jgi:curved DNA-binding protein CbpA
MSERTTQPPYPEPHPALALLGLRVPYTRQDAEQAFREAAKAAHPDHGGDPSRFKELQSAYEQALALLDERRARRTPPTGPPQIPLPRRRSSPSTSSGRTLSFLYLGVRVAAVVALLTAFLAGALTLWDARQNTAQRVDGRAADRIAELGGSVEWDGSNVSHVSLHGLEATAERLEALRRFGMLEHLDLSGTTLDDAALVQVLPLVSLREINLSGTQVTDVGVSLLGSLAGLETLILDNTRITDAALGSLDQLPKLQVASVRDTAVTLAGIARARYPDRYHRDSALGGDAERAVALADFLPERQWVVQELRSSLADFGLLTSEDLREATRIDLAVVYEREALSNPVLDSAFDLGPLPLAPSVRPRRVATLADLVANGEGAALGGGGTITGGAGPKLAGTRSSSSRKNEEGKGAADEDDEESKADAPPRELSSIFGRQSRSRSNQASVTWLLPQPKPDSRLRPGFLMLERPQPETELADDREAPSLLPLEGKKPWERDSAPKLDLPKTKRRNFYLGEIGGNQPRTFQDLPGSARGRSNPFGVPGFGGPSLNPFEPSNPASPTGHLDALRRGSRMTAPGSR